MKEIRITYQMEDEDGVVSEASIVLPMSFGIALDYNGPWVSDQGSKKEREHGMMKQR